MGACETTPPATPGDTHATLKASAKGPFLTVDDLAPFAGVQLVRPRRCAAAGAPARPLPHGDTTCSCEKDPKQ